LVTRTHQRLLEQLFRRAKSQSLAYELSAPQAAPPDSLSCPPPSPVVSDVKHHCAASRHTSLTSPLQVVACTLQPLLLAAAASTFASQFCHVVARSLSSPPSLVSSGSNTTFTVTGPTLAHSDAATALIPSSFLMSASVHVLIAEHSATCAEARIKLCSAWAVAAAPLLLSQVTQHLICDACCDFHASCLISYGAMCGCNCWRRQQLTVQAAPISNGLCRMRRRKEGK
jgi:hypothetical protein